MKPNRARRPLERAAVLAYIVIAVPPSLIALAGVVAVIRARKEDLPAIVRALMRTGPRDNERAEVDAEDGPKGLPAASESTTDTGSSPPANP
jgi:hypothetical protein